MSRSTVLGHFLRSRRQGLPPELVGLPPDPRRRSPGLRREEVAVLANVSPSWYTYLEQGRSVRPSVEVLDSLADALRLDGTNRRYLQALGASPSDSVLTDPAPDAVLVDQVHRLMTAGGDTSYPVYAMDEAGYVVASNAQMTEWYDDLAARHGLESNMVWWLFTSPRARVRIVNWEDDARDVVARLRFSVAVSRSTSRMGAVLRGLLAESPEFARWWGYHEVTDQESQQRVFRHPRFGERPLDLYVVRPAQSPSMTIVFHLPLEDDRELPGGVAGCT